MSVLQAIIYGIIQGITEFLPISSDGHLAFYALLIHKPGENPLPIAASVLMHAASLLAIALIFRREIIRLFFEDRRLGFAICLATIPAVILGLGLHSFFEISTQWPLFVSLCFILNGLVLIAGSMISRSLTVHSKVETQLSIPQIFLIGIAQSAALLPGVSRSGMTISAGRSLGLDGSASVRFSFLLGTPAIAGAVALETLKLLKDGAPLGLDPLPAATGFIASFIFSWLALIVLLKIIRRVGLWVFSPYIFAVGIAGLIYFGLIR